MLTALHKLGPDAEQLHLVVYTDSPQHFDGLPVHVHALTDADVHAWCDKPRAYNNRAKTRAMMDARDRWQLPLVYVDGDTWWKRSPMTLVNRLRPGRAVMHVPESTLLHSPDQRSRRLADHLRHTDIALRDERFRIAPDAVMWNSGVVGLHPTDAHLLDDAGDLAQQLWDGLPGQPFLEQFSLGQVLGQHVQLVESRTHLFHYWMAHLRTDFRARLPRLLAELAPLPLPEQAALAYAQRPRPRGVQAAKVGAKHALQAVGLPVGRSRSSA